MLRGRVSTVGNVLALHEKKNSGSHLKVLIIIINISSKILRLHHQPKSCFYNLSLWVYLFRQLNFKTSVKSFPSLLNGILSFKVLYKFVVCSHLSKNYWLTITTFFWSLKYISTCYLQSQNVERTCNLHLTNDDKIYISLHWTQTFPFLYQERAMQPTKRNVPPLQYIKLFIFVFKVYIGIELSILR